MPPQCDVSRSCSGGSQENVERLVGTATTPSPALDAATAVSAAITGGIAPTEASATSAATVVCFRRSCPVAAVPPALSIWARTLNVMVQLTLSGTLIGTTNLVAVYLASYKGCHLSYGPIRQFHLLYSHRLRCTHTADPASSGPDKISLSASIPKIVSSLLPCRCPP